MKYLLVFTLFLGLPALLSCHETSSSTKGKLDHPDANKEQLYSENPKSTILPEKTTPEERPTQIEKKQTPASISKKNNTPNKMPKTVEEVKPKAPSKLVSNTKSNPKEPSRPLDQSTSENENVSNLSSSKPPLNVANVEPAASEAEVEMVLKERQASTKPNHDSWDELLRKYVSANGKVNYSGLVADKAKLQSYLDELANHPDQSDWSRSEKMAYWINVYNAFTIKLIIDNYPLSSITKLHNGKPWDVKWIKLGDKTYSLNQVENDILRPVYKDARIHFAVNCAAKSCPPLLNRAWTAGNLNSYLERQTKSFINNSSFNSLKVNTVEVSKIFEWYSVDFGNLIAFLNKYSETSVSRDAQIGFMEYDWALNN